MGIRDTAFHDFRFVQPVTTDQMPVLAGLSGSVFNKVIADISGNFYAVGSIPTDIDGNLVRSMIVVKSADSGRTWNILDNYIVSTTTDLLLPISASTDGKAIAIHSASNELYTGYTWRAQAGVATIFSFRKANLNTTPLSWSIVGSIIQFGGTNLPSIGDMAFDEYTALSSPDDRRLYAITTSDTSTAHSFIYRISLSASFFSSSLIGTVTGQASQPQARSLFITASAGSAQFYCAAFEWNVFSSIGGGPVVKRYVNDLTWSLIDGIPTGTLDPRRVSYNFLFGKNGSLYVGGFSGTQAIIRKSTTLASGSFTTVLLSGSPGLSSSIESLKINSRGTVYAVGSEKTSATTGSFLVKASFDNGTNWQTIKSINKLASKDTAKSIATFNDKIVVVGSSSGNNIVVFGKQNENSQSLGPAMLNTSFAYIQPQPYAETDTTLYKLNNVSEFAYNGLKSLVFGTQEKGKIGNTEDSILQIKHIGSVVRVMWPKQDSIDKPVKGFGDFSAGERPGKLSNDFQPGEDFDVTEFDHVCLYGYLSKQVSGTLDDVVIVVERKPLNDSAFTTEQSLQYVVSGSVVEGRLRDLQYRKEIDYGDLSIRNIGFPIDIPLVNTKVLRVSVKHKNGQSVEENKNFILWGRFIKNSKDTNET